MSDTQLSQAARPAERRRSRRFPCDLELDIEWGATVLRGAVTEISAEGMFVQLESPLWIGANFAARLAVDESVAVDCVVRRVEPRRGMGLTFQASQESGRAAVLSLLQRLAAR